ncbi:MULTISPECIES: hypothetical protein [Mycobacteriaceae]|uniref:hypothetical protein n=1 Tax=Mycobacteriaceae TaxID=1762 RepID=UPI0007EA3423|nr:hypothetical protein [Mycolicibacterium fortuitum]OBA94665.1 hypothetical protein A5668_09190 [Mycolicibacterium fortuitum]
MRIQWNEAGFDALLTGAHAQGLVDDAANDLAERANAVPSTTDPVATEPYYEVQDGSDNKRARRRVRAVGARAMRHEAKTNALQKALGGA